MTATSPPPTATETDDEARSAPRPDTGVDAVTGAFSYSGAAIARRLAQQGRTIRTLTGHPGRAPEGSTVDVHPLAFDDLPGLVDSLRGVTTLYNTYWVRFAKGATTHDIAVANCQTLFSAARAAGVAKIVHVSITHPSIESPYPYFSGKAYAERALAASGVPYTILRPAILFGGDGVLINNIAWLLRHLPVFGIGGDGRYRIRGIHIDDLAELAVTAAGERDDRIIDAVGPERPTFEELVGQLRVAVRSRSHIVHVPGRLLPPLSMLLGTVMHDVVLTTDEFDAMSGGLADTDGPATGSTLLSTWITENADTLGRTYANEITRHFS